MRVRHRITDALLWLFAVAAFWAVLAIGRESSEPEGGSPYRCPRGRPECRCLRYYAMTRPAVTRLR